MAWSTSPTSPPSWSDLLPQLLGLVIAHLPFPADRAHFHAVCRAWRSAARRHVHQLLWIFAERVKAKHSYFLHNPFSGTVVPLPELDYVISFVAKMFKIRKVLMQSSNPDDVLTVTTNNCDYNVISCHPRKEIWVLPDFRIFDVAFLGDWLYEITPDEYRLVDSGFSRQSWCFDVQ